MTGRNRREKKKRRESDSDSSENKRTNIQKTPEGLNSISQVLSEASAVLFDEGINVSISNRFEQLDNVSDTYPDPVITMAGRWSHDEPTNSDIVAMLGRIDLKLKDMDQSLKRIESLEIKVDNFDKELKKIWLHLDKFTNEISDKVNRVEHKVDSVDIELEGARRRIADLERDKDKLKEDMNYVQSQSMRNNLIFGNIPEVQDETPAKTEQIVREFIVSNLKVTKEEVDGMRFERVHRMGQKQNQSAGQGPTREANNQRHRSIVCKFFFRR
ncbi:hypothetical protein DPMN_110949 [Dreissena polymorpha]|uniref:t-SNARE coiled-coil homology domain-containing protein n=1 Tax=Dreissena polymorpha TaxID=45954 RepID=A0A9D4QND3_DREPO|nr:hypothetical protein DPMN_110949 [Dreissena polymorpha]